jgi:hypothetical protein
VERTLDWPRGKRRCVGRRSSHPDGPITAGIPLMEMTSKNVPSLDETVPLCDGDTRSGGVDGCVCKCCEQQAASPADRHVLLAMRTCKYGVVCG